LDSIVTLLYQSRYNVLFCLLQQSNDTEKGCPLQPFCLICALLTWFTSKMHTLCFAVVPLGCIRLGYGSKRLMTRLNCSVPENHLSDP
jgi:hypothetical protein